MNRHRPPLHDEWKQDALADIERLALEDPRLADAAWAVVDDVLGHHKTGKELGIRNLSGDLTGLRRVKFDLPGRRSERCRLVYQVTDAESVLITPCPNHYRRGADGWPGRGVDPNDLTPQTLFTANDAWRPNNGVEVSSWRRSGRGGGQNWPGNGVRAAVLAG
jgi:hypothetical protein